MDRARDVANPRINLRFRLKAPTRVSHFGSARKHHHRGKGSGPSAKACPSPDRKEHPMSTSEDYKAKAAEALVQLSAHKTAAATTPLRRATSVSVEPSNNRAHAPARAETSPPN